MEQVDLVQQEENSMKKTKKVMKWLLLILWLGVIFYMSSESGEVSSNTSSKVLNIVESIFPFVKNNVELFTMLLRKSAHILEYFILGVLIFEVVKEYCTIRKEIFIISLLIFLLCATLDEIHQLFTFGRAGRIIDVLIDSIGFIFSIGICSFIENNKKCTICVQKRSKSK